MSQKENGWEEYYRAIIGRPTRLLFLDALAYFPGDDALK